MTSPETVLFTKANWLKHNGTEKSWENVCGVTTQHKNKKLDGMNVDTFIETFPTQADFWKYKGVSKRSVAAALAIITSTGKEWPQIRRSAMILH